MHRNYGITVYDSRMKRRPTKAQLQTEGHDRKEIFSFAVSMIRQYIAFKRNLIRLSPDEELRKFHEAQKWTRKLIDPANLQKIVRRNPAFRKMALYFLQEISYETYEKNYSSFSEQEQLLAQELGVSPLQLSLQEALYDRQLDRVGDSCEAFEAFIELLVGSCSWLPKAYIEMISITREELNVLYDDCSISAELGEHTVKQLVLTTDTYPKSLYEMHMRTPILETDFGYLICPFLLKISMSYRVGVVWHLLDLDNCLTESCSS